jgi:hypothetical protein
VDISLPLELHMDISIPPELLLVVSELQVVSVSLQLQLDISPHNTMYH